VREPQSPRKTGRQKRFDDSVELWRETRRRLAAYRRTPRAIPRVGRIRGPEFIRALLVAAEATGDPRFTAAFEAARSYRLDREFHRTAARLHDPDEGYLVHVDFFHRRGKLENGKRRQMSVLEACEIVVAEFGLGRSFEREASDLPKAKAVQSIGGQFAISGRKRPHSTPRHPF
jgi:hypothetical protein